MKDKDIVCNNGSIKELTERVRKAQNIFSTYTQTEVDKIFHHAAKAACRERIRLARLAVEETGMGIPEDKVIKNHYASEYIYNSYKDTATCGVIEEDRIAGISKIAEPIGVIAALVPTTNPTSTAIFKALISLKTRNGIIFAPHPRAKRASCEAAKVVYRAALEAGAPEGIIAWLDEPSVESTNELMKSCDLTLATGGQKMVRAAYSAGRPAIGVGAGNTPAIIDSSADIKQAVSSVILSKSFDNGLICASEQSVVVLSDIYNSVRDEFEYRGCYFIREEELENIRELLFVDGVLNSKIVGKSAFEIAEMAGINVPFDTRLLIAELTNYTSEELLSAEKLSPVLSMYRANDFESALDISYELISNGGIGHTAAIYIDREGEEKRLNAFTDRMKACRILVNTPSSQGAIGDIYNFGLTPSLTLGCGSWGGNSVSENVGVKHLLNIKTVVERRENMLWFRVPKRVYIKRGCLEYALYELKDKKRVFIVTDKFLYDNGYTDRLCTRLSEMGITYTIFSDVESDPTLKTARRGAEEMRAFLPDAVIALGGGSPIDAAKVMRLLYEEPDADFTDMSMRFADIRKRIYRFPVAGSKASLTAIPTTAGTGSELTPFAVITDETSGVKYPLADYELMPDTAIIDPSLTDDAPRSLTAAAGIDALTHAIEAYTSMLATDYTDPLALCAVKNIFEYLPRAYDKGKSDTAARDKMADAAASAGMAFANAFLGICHSMAHKLGSYFHLPHGVANALLICEVITFNSEEAPYKMGTFPQYKYPCVKKKYAEIADMLSLGGNDDCEKTMNLIKAINELKSRIGIKQRIRDYGISEKEFRAVVEKMSIDAFDDQCTGANPRFPLISEIKEIYMRAF
ncbi:MAG: bifunctional acetaldehyde-CoA/alcohol dehydrogenase [Ruminococcaceae bacterium]|nr:bifunctional acetaldehyde-CoA/alcohol dehydrogenase [Oscillospiraceae bacterium]